MDSAISDKIKKTQNAFPKQSPGAVAKCPLAKKSTPTQPAAQTSPVEVKTNFALTQQILQTMGARQMPEKAREKKAWIEILLVDNEGKPMPGVRYRITPPGGKPVEGRLNQYGQAGLYQIEPGNCKITFPDLDKEAWD